MTNSFLSSFSTPSALARRLKSAAFVALALIFGAFTLASCDILKTEPRQSIDAEIALDTVSGFESLLISTYSRLLTFGFAEGHYGAQYTIEPDVLADNMNLKTNPERLASSLRNESGAHLTRYEGFYAAINETNLAIANIGGLDDPEADSTFKARVEGEARYLRALNYFDLMRSYAYTPGQAVDGFTQGVILRTEPVDDATEADFRARSSISEVYDQIETDLQEAATLLDGAYQEDGGPPVYRANTAAAQALLSRVYLYAQEWQNAADAATAAIELANGDLGVQLAPDSASYVEAFAQAPNPESIFEVNIDPTQNNANENLNLYTTEQTGFGGAFLVSQDLLDAINPDDARLGLYNTTTIPNDGEVTYLRKYQGDRGNQTDNIPIIRISEVYLNRAEARAELQNAQGARNDLNAIRSRVQLDDVDPNLSGQALIDAILHERRVELAFEGHRFHDLKRRGMDIPKPQPLVQRDEVPYESFLILAPLPQSEVDQNPQLDQNPGY